MDGVILVVVVLVDVEVSVVWPSIGMTTVLGAPSSRSTEMRSCPGSSNDRIVEATSPSCAPCILVMPISSELYVGKPGSVWYMGGGSLSGTIASPGPIPRVNIWLLLPGPHRHRPVTTLLEDRRTLEGSPPSSSSSSSSSSWLSVSAKESRWSE